MTTRRLACALGALAMVSGALADDRTAAPPDERTATERLASFFLRTKGVTRLVPASEVWESIRSGDARYVIVDVRPVDDFEKGHLPGAINLPIDVLFRPASLANLPAPEGARPILLVCNSGHTESMALGGLVALGYEPWVLKFGMIGWNAETRLKAGSPSQEADTVHGVGGPIER